MNGPSLLLVVADTTRADALAPPGSPLADAARAGRTYARATSPAPWTPPAHASMLTGLAPSEHGVWRANLFDDQGRPCPKPVRGEVAERWLPARLAAAGYRTLGISANPWVAPYFGFDHGFERFESLKDWGPRWANRSLSARVARRLPAPLARRLRRRRLATRMRHGGPDSGAAYALRTMSAWLAESDRPFFAFLNLMEAHWPYRPPAGLEGFSPREARDAVDLLARLGQFKRFTLEAYFGRAELAAEERAVLRRLYQGEVAYLERRLVELLDRLGAAGRLDDTVVVVVADHGEQLGEHGLYGHGSSLYEQLLHVPLLVLGPEELVGRGVEDARVSTRRLYHALLDWAGCEAASLVSDEPVVADYEGVWSHAGSLRRLRNPPDDPRLKATVWALYGGPWKYVRDQTGEERLHNLDTDPSETTDAQADGPRSTLRRQLAEVLAERRPCLLGPQAGQGERDLATEAELRALGYL
jgi:arylsulfatase A-like enzyme